MSLLGVLASAAATQAPTRDQCAGTDPDLSIATCTALINGGLETQARLAVDYFERGNACRRKDEFDQAITDYDMAIRIKPAYASAFFNRGSIYRDKGRYDDAIADYDEAIRLKSDFALTEEVRPMSSILRYDLRAVDWVAQRSTPGENRSSNPRMQMVALDQDRMHCVDVASGPRLRPTRSGGGTPCLSGRRDVSSGFLRECGSRLRPGLASPVALFRVPRRRTPANSRTGRGRGHHA
jgi:Tetratricopeptide repeat